MGTWKQNRSRKPLSLDDCKLRMTDAIKQMEKIVMTASEDERNLQIQAVHAMSGLINRYSKLIETAEFEQRLTEIENKLETHVPTATHWRN